MLHSFGMSQPHQPAEHAVSATYYQKGQADDVEVPVMYRRDDEPSWVPS